MHPHPRVGVLGLESLGGSHGKESWARVLGWVFWGGSSEVGVLEWEFWPLGWEFWGESSGVDISFCTLGFISE